MNTQSIEHESSTRKRADVGRYFLRLATPVGVRCAHTEEFSPPGGPNLAGGLPVIEARELAPDEAWMVQPLAELLAELDAIAAGRGAQ